MMNFGIEGESYTVEDGKYVYTDVILNNPDGLSISEALQMYCRATAQAPGFKQAPEYLEQYYEYPQQTEALKLWEANTEPNRQTMLPTLNSTPEEAETIASIKAELETYVDEQRWNFVTGKESLDNYDQFVETLKNTFRVEEYQAILQAQYGALSCKVAIQLRIHNRIWRRSYDNEERFQKKVWRSFLTYFIIAPALCCSQSGWVYGGRAGAAKRD